MVLAAPRPGPAGIEAVAVLRELLVLRAWREDACAGTFVLASRSVLDDSRPPSHGMERGELLPSGYIITESPGSGPTTTVLTFIGQFDHATFEFARPHAVQVFKKFREVM